MDNCLSLPPFCVYYPGDTKTKRNEKYVERTEIFTIQIYTLSSYYLFIFFLELEFV